MNLSDTIHAQAQALPPALQREALDFIAYLQQRYHITQPMASQLSTEAFIQRFAGSVGADFPDDIDEADLAPETPRESLE